MARRNEEQEERHDLEVREEDERIVVREVSEGADTRTVYGVERHIHWVELRKEAFQPLASRLSVGESELAEAIGSFVGAGYLTDLMDVLDIAGIRYGYVADDGAEAVMRPAGA